MQGASPSTSLASTTHPHPLGPAPADIPGDQVLQRLRDDPATAAIPGRHRERPMQHRAKRNASRRPAPSAYLSNRFNVSELLRIVDDLLSEVQVTFGW